MLISYNNCGKGFQAQKLNSVSSCVSISKASPEYISIDGWFRIQLAFSESTEWESFWLETVEQKKYELVFSDPLIAKKIPANSYIRLTGRFNTSSQIIVDAPPEAQEIPPIEYLYDDQPQALTTTGTRRVLAILGNFTSGSACDTSAVNEALFGGAPSLKNFYSAVSRNELNFEGEIAGPFNISFDGSSCLDNYSQWNSALSQAASAAGFNLSQFDHILYFYNIGGCPHPSGGRILGTANLGGKNGWMYVCDNNMAINHELGHNLSLHHAGVPPGTGMSAYDDGSDVMGNRGVFLVNAPHREQKGWVPAGKILRPTTNATIELAPIDVDPNSTTRPQVFTINKGSEKIYFSYRKNTGVYTNFSNTYLNKLNIHSYSGGASLTLFLDSLNDGESYRINEAKATITQISHDAEHVKVKVEFDGDPGACTEQSPNMSITTLPEPAKSERLFKVQITNNDTGENCPARTYSLEIQNPSPFTPTITTSPINLNKGQSGDINVKLTAPVGTEGTYTITFKVQASAPAIAAPISESKTIILTKESQKSGSCP